MGISFAVLLLGSLAAALTLPAKGYRRSPTVSPASNTSSSNPRATWLPGFDLDTNYYDKVPDTGVTREYFFDITNTTKSPDGRERIVLLVNGQIPGPTIIADWGDMVKVHVTNSMQDNGTSIHFHGIRQLDTNQNDGVTSVTQCPVAPGSSYTYTWQASQYGSSWYHSHFSLQAWDGVFGGIVVNGPASADYDEDSGNLFLNDWNPYTVDSRYVESLVVPAAPQSDNGLLNGTNSFTTPNGSTVGSRLELKFASGKRYRIRLVNAAVHTGFRFSIDEHNLTVITSDFTPIQPYFTDSIFINMGQRYDVIVQANDQTSGNYWIRAYPVTACSNNANPDNIKGIIRYDASSIADPTTTAWPNQDYTNCIDEPLASLTAWLQLNAPQDLNVVNMTVGFNGFESEFLWTIDSTPFNNTWSDPMLKQLSDAGNISSSINNVLYINEPNAWTVLVFNNNAFLAHPMHLHGHDFWIVGSGDTYFDGDVSQFSLDGPPRRDTTTMPFPGWVAIAFPADNPGVWLVHCHIGFHTTSGLAMQIVERQGEILQYVDAAALDDTCTAWTDYRKVDYYGNQDQQPEGPFDDGV